LRPLARPALERNLDTLEGKGKVFDRGAIELLRLAIGGALALGVGRRKARQAIKPVSVEVMLLGRARIAFFFSRVC